MLILEGPDGGGKTSLSQHEDIAPEFLSPAHQGPYSGDVFTTTLTKVMELTRRAKAAERGVIFDRLHLGEHVYGPIYRDGSRLSLAHSRMIDRVLLGYGAVAVLCLPPFEVARNNWQGRSESEMFPNDVAKYSQVWGAYNVLDTYTHLPVVRYDFTTHSPSMLMTAVSYAHTSPNCGPGTGSFSPGNTLIVGEQISNVNDLTPWPFVGQSGCSLWLAQQLDKWAVNEQDLYWINALDRHGKPTDDEFLNLLQPKKVIALGNAANEWCKSSGLDFHKVHHPQYHKRFKSNEYYELEGLLR